MLFEDFFLGKIDLSRINFGIITLIPKKKGVDNIKQFRPILFVKCGVQNISKSAFN
jgi:hypothetical protein